MNTYAQCHDQEIICELADFEVFFDDTWISEACPSVSGVVSSARWFC